MSSIKIKQCEEANLLAGDNGSCESCPFTECLEFLDYNIRRGIRVILRERECIKNLYNLRDSGETVESAARKIKCPRSTTEDWLAKRKKYERLFAGDISGLFSGNGKVNE